MDYHEFRRHLGKANLTVNDFAGYLGVKPSSVSNYAKRAHVPRAYAALAVLMGDMADRAIEYQAVLGRFGIHATQHGRNVHSLAAARSARIGGHSPNSIK